jgi:hypothetical protein
LLNFRKKRDVQRKGGGVLPQDRVLLRRWIRQNPDEHLVVFLINIHILW